MSLNNIIEAYVEDMADNYINWRNQLYKETRGGVEMFDVPHYYKWLTEDELIIYYMDFGRFESKL